MLKLELRFFILNLIDLAYFEFFKLLLTYIGSKNLGFVSLIFMFSIFCIVSCYFSVVPIFWHLGVLWLYNVVTSCKIDGVGLALDENNNGGLFCYLLSI